MPLVVFSPQTNILNTAAGNNTQTLVFFLYNYFLFRYIGLICKIFNVSLTEVPLMYKLPIINIGKTILINYNINIWKNISKQRFEFYLYCHLFKNLFVCSANIYTASLICSWKSLLTKSPDCPEAKLRYSNLRRLQLISCVHSNCTYSN